TLGSVPPSLTTTPTITFTNENDNGPAGIAKFQVQIHKASDDSVVASWADFTSGSSVTGLTLQDGEDHYAKVRAVDNAGNTSSGADSQEWTASVILIATISGEPSDPSSDVELDITVSGANITHYRFKVGETS